MVGHHTETHVVGGIGTVSAAGEFGGTPDDGEHLVDLVHVVHALQQQGGALQPGAGVDVACRQRAGDVEVVLGAHGGELLGLEHEVPDLQEAVLVGLGAAVGAEGGAAVDVDLRAGAAGAGDAHVPVVVLESTLLDVGARDAHLLPQVDGLVVAVQGGDPDLVGVESPVALGDAARHQFEGVGDGLFLEVVTEGEVAVHLEERAVTGGDAHLVDVEGAHTLLHGHGPLVGRLLLTEEVRLEGHHASVHEQEGGVVVQQ